MFQPAGDCRQIVYSWSFPSFGKQLLLLVKIPDAFWDAAAEGLFRVLMFSIDSGLTP